MVLSAMCSGWDWQSLVHELSKGASRFRSGRVLSFRVLSNVAVDFLAPPPLAYAASGMASAHRPVIFSRPAPLGFRVDAPWLTWLKHPTRCRRQGPRLGAKRHL